LRRRTIAEPEGLRGLRVPPPLALLPVGLWGVYPEWLLELLAELVWAVLVELRSVEV
jgi:hypothetical protein